MGERVSPTWDSVRSGPGNLAMKGDCQICWGTGRSQDWAGLGARVRARRIRSGLTLAQLAARLGITEGALCLKEQGKRGWTRELYERAMGSSRNS